MFTSNVSTAVRASAILGVLFHVVINPIEFELYLFHFFGAYVAAFVAYTYTLAQSDGQKFSAALLQAFLVFASFGASTLVSIAVYRIFFHRCRKFKGPPLAKLTRFTATYLNSKDIPFSKQLGKFHEQYGKVVRIGPRELSILEKDAIPLIYGANSECRKATFYGQSGNDSTKVSINMTRDKKSYRLRRRAWDQGFSIKALTTYQPRVKAKADALIEQLYSHSGQTIDGTKWANLFLFDVMGEVGFSKDFRSIQSGQEHPASKAVHDHLAILGVMQTVPWLLNLLSIIPGAASGFSEFFSVCEKEMTEKERTWDSSKEPKDVASWLLKPVKEKDITASPTKESLTDDSRVLIVAGSDTSASTLTNILFYLAKNQPIQRKLQSLLDSAMPRGYSEWDYEKIKTVTYIDDIIKETLRLKPPVLQGSARETPAQGLRIGDLYIPGNVNVSVSHYLIQRDPRYWKRPNEFVPERWNEKREDMGTDGAPFLPFQLGLHNCAGKGLAYLILRIAVSAIAQNFDVELAPGETMEDFDERFVDFFLISLPQLKLHFMPRRKA